MEKKPPRPGASFGMSLDRALDLAMDPGPAFRVHISGEKAVVEGAPTELKPKTPARPKTKRKR